MEYQNDFTMNFKAVSENESFARMVVSMFLAQMNPNLEEMEDVKTAVSEAVTNAVVHGYRNMDGDNRVELHCTKEKDILTIIIRDYGVGIENVSLAMEPFFTTLEEEERSGMGFAFMEAFMDELNVESGVGEGTTITMAKQIRGGSVK